MSLEEVDVVWYSQERCLLEVSQLHHEIITSCAYNTVNHLDSKKQAQIW